MSYQSKMATKTTSVPGGLIIGLLTSWSVTILMTVLITYLVVKKAMAETALAPAAVGTILLAAFSAAMIAAAKIGSRRMIICLCSGGLYYLTLLCCNALFFDGTYQGLLPALLMIFGASAVAGLMGLRQKDRKFKGIKGLYKV